MLKLRIEYFPVVQFSSSLYFQRARAIILDDSMRLNSQLGSGISASTIEAKAKATSEAIERLVVSKNSHSYVDWSAVNLVGSLLSPTIKHTSKNDNMPRFEHNIASACHTSIVAAIQSALVEAIERRHQWEWTQKFKLPGEVLTQLMSSETILKFVPIWDQLDTRWLRVLSSWALPVKNLPSVVCVAIDEKGGYFFCGSASAFNRNEAVRLALLDIVKLLMVEKTFNGKANSFGFRRKLDEHFDAMRCLQSVEVYNPQQFADSQIAHHLDANTVARLYSSTWLTLLGRHVVAVPLNVSGDRRPELEWFE